VLLNLVDRKRLSTWQVSKVFQKQKHQMLG
jgi:hypothetical protein